MKTQLLELLAQPAVITALAGLAAYLIAKLFTAKPAWQQYQGLMITAVKAAEKMIPDDTFNAGLARADYALKEFIRQYVDTYAMHPTTALVQEVRANLPIVHDMVEANGTL